MYVRSLDIVKLNGELLYEQASKLSNPIFSWQWEPLVHIHRDGNSRRLADTFLPLK